MGDEPRIPPLPPDEWSGDVKRILDTVVDSFGVEDPTGGDIVVRLEKLKVSL